MSPIHTHHLKMHHECQLQDALTDLGSTRVRLISVSSAVLQRFWFCRHIHGLPRLQHLGGRDRQVYCKRHRVLGKEETQWWVFKANAIEVYANFLEESCIQMLDHATFDRFRCMHSACLKLRCAGGREINPRPGQYTPVVG